MAVSFLTEWSRDRDCWSVSGGQPVYAAKFSGHSRPDPSSVTPVSVWQSVADSQTQIGTEAQPRLPGSGHLQGRYQAPVAARHTAERSTCILPLNHPITPGW